MNSRENTQKLSECVRYFMKKNGYRRVFQLMRKKWKKYGKIAGRIVLENPSLEEREILERFFSREFSDNPIRFSMVEFDEALQQTRFCGIRLELLLSAYFDEELITNQEEKRQKQQNKKKFFQELLDWAGNTYGQESSSIAWLTKVICDKRYGYHLINKEYERNSNAIYNKVQQVCHAIQFIEKNRGVRLAVLGAEITKNPHEYDRNTISGRILIQALSFLNYGMPCKTAEEILMLYYISGMKPDDISSFTVVYGIHLYTDSGEHPAYKGFIESGETYVITLSNLGKIKKAGARENKVYVVENQMVFSHLCEALQGKEYALVCTSGQLKTASLMLLDMLREAGCSIFYSGDFDPEGIGIAEKVLVRNDGYAKLWHMTKEDYEFCLSEEEISEDRIHKLDKITHPCLQEVKLLMCKKKKAGYQERLIEGMLYDILRKTN